jgi:DNA-binding winged helix-turn-helix (wHTH) protein
MFVTKGPVDPESRLFVGRSEELQKIETWLRSVSCVGAVLGARQTGKTSLLLRLRHLFREKYCIVFIDLQAIEGAGPERCFAYIAGEIAEHLAHISVGGEAPLPQDGETFLKFLQQAAKHAPVRLGVILDEVGSLPAATMLKLSNAIRAVFTDRLVKPEYGRYVFLVAGAADALECTTGRNSPLKNVTETLYLDDLSLAETEQLLEEGLRGAWSDSLPEITRLVYTWTRGHPYWTQLLGAALERQSAVPTESTIRDTVRHLLQTEDTNLPHIVKALQGETNSWSLVESMLDGAPISFSRANPVAARLELIGVVKNQGGHCEIRNQIYREAIRLLQRIETSPAAATLHLLRESIERATDLKTLADVLAEQVQRFLGTGTAVVYTREPGANNFQATAKIGTLEHSLAQLKFDADSRLVTLAEPAFDPRRQDLPKAEHVLLAKIGSALIVPMRAKGETLGFLSLGLKTSGGGYHPEDLKFVVAAAHLAAHGMERTHAQWKNPRGRFRAQSDGLYEFGPYQLDTAQRSLICGGENVALAPKTFNLLVLFVTSRGRVLTKNELIHTLWPDTIAAEANLAFQVSALRRKLGKQATGWIQAVPKYGYRFTAKVTAAS